MVIILMMVILKAGGCDSVFRATCPWDTAGMTNIAMKLMASQVGDNYDDVDGDNDDDDEDGNDGEDEVIDDADGI